MKLSCMCLLMFVSLCAQTGNGQGNSPYVDPTDISGSGKQRAIERPVPKRKAEDIISTEKIKSLIEGLKNSDDSIKAQTLNELEQLLKNIKMERESKRFDAKVRGLEYSPDFNAYAVAYNNLVVAVCPPTAELLYSKDHEIRMAAINILARAEGSASQGAVINYAFAHRDDKDGDEFCDVIFAAKTEVLWRSVFYNPDDGLFKKCTENKKYSPEDRDELLDFIGKTKLRKQREKSEMQQMQELDRQKDARRGSETMPIVLCGVAVTIWLFFRTAKNISLGLLFYSAVPFGGGVMTLLMSIFSLFLTHGQPDSIASLLLVIFLAPFPTSCLAIVSVWSAILIRDMIGKQWKVGFLYWSLASVLWVLTFAFWGYLAVNNKFFI